MSGSLSRRSFVFAGLVASLLPGYALAQAGLRDALRQGGHVIYFRHGATTWSGIDNIEWPR